MGFGAWGRNSSPVIEYASHWCEHFGLRFRAVRSSSVMFIFAVCAQQGHPPCGWRGFLVGLELWEKSGEADAFGYMAQSTY